MKKMELNAAADNFSKEERDAMSPSVRDPLVQWARIRPSRYALIYALIYCTQGAALVSQQGSPQKRM